MVVIAIPNHTFPPSSDALKLADRVLESITELCAEGVLEAAGSGRAELNERV
jgi:hypothetical protein